jgi:phosphocarrier protein
MSEKTVTVKNQQGLHARPAALFVQKAASYPFPITIGKGGKTVDAKSILMIMSLAVKKDDSVELQTPQDDEKSREALDALEAILIDETMA